MWPRSLALSFPLDLKTFVWFHQLFVYLQDFFSFFVGKIFMQKLNENFRQSQLNWKKDHTHASTGKKVKNLFYDFPVFTILNLIKLRQNFSLVVSFQVNFKGFRQPIISWASQRFARTFNDSKFCVNTGNMMLNFLILPLWKLACKTHIALEQLFSSRNAIRCDWKNQKIKFHWTEQ